MSCPSPYSGLSFWVNSFTHSPWDMNSHIKGRLYSWLEHLSSSSTSSHSSLLSRSSKFSRSLSSPSFSSSISSSTHNLVLLRPNTTLTLRSGNLDVSLSTLTSSYSYYASEISSQFSSLRITNDQYLSNTCCMYSHFTQHCNAQRSVQNYKSILFDEYFPTIIQG